VCVWSPFCLLSLFSLFAFQEEGDRRAENGGRVTSLLFLSFSLVVRGGRGTAQAGSSWSCVRPFFFSSFYSPFFLSEERRPWVVGRFLPPVPPPFSLPPPPFSLSKGVAEPGVVTVARWACLPHFFFHSPVLFFFFFFFFFFFRGRSHSGAPVRSSVFPLLLTPFSLPFFLFFGADTPVGRGEAGAAPPSYSLPFFFFFVQSGDRER